MDKRILLFLVTVLVFGSLAVHLYIDYKGSGDEEGKVFHLVEPAFAQSMSTAPTFLDEEAGISLYVNIGQSIDLAAAKTVYRTLEKETANYTVGSVALPSLSENEDVHCFVHKDGWIITYYLKGEPVSKIVDWNLWSQGKLTKNKLQVGLEQMTNALGALVTGVKYYHFQYPNANKCMIILETLAGSGVDSFNITIPNDLTVYERSWSHYSQYLYAGYGTVHHSYFKIDGNTINTISGNNNAVTNCGTLLVAQLFPSAVHIVSVSGEESGSYLYGVCVALVYQEP